MHSELLRFEDQPEELQCILSQQRSRLNQELSNHRDNAAFFIVEILELWCLHLAKLLDFVDELLEEIRLVIVVKLSAFVLREESNQSQGILNHFFFCHRFSLFLLETICRRVCSVIVTAGIVSIGLVESYLRDS